jgi:hypothetical protein
MPEGARKNMLDSWAAYAFSKNPTAEKLTIRVEVFDPPTMQEFAAGKAADWQLFGEFGPFVRETKAADLIAE